MTLWYVRRRNSFLRKGHCMKYDNNEKYFSCYSPKLKDFLEEFGFEPIEIFTHLKTNKICWVFEKTDSLGLYLERWTKNK